MKTCTKCKEERDETEFQEKKSKCKICTNEYHRIYRKKNREKNRKKEKNEKENKLKGKRWKEKNRDIC